jgi:protein-S-isoprenylcysteine O-methyltransferase Ste14
MTPVRAAVRLVTMLVVCGGALSLLAGTIRWPAAWAYLAAILIIMLTYTVIVMRLHPDLADERRRPPTDAKAWDKPLVAVVAGVGPIALIVLSGLDRRFHWSPPMPAWAQIVALAAGFSGGMFSNWAVAANRFFSALVRIQHDRGHHVIDRGPYALVRHPGYAGSIVYMLGMAVALGSRATIAVTLFVVAVTVYRTAREDRTLQAELDGYAAYAQRVRYRLLPGMW